MNKVTEFFKTNFWMILAKNTIKLIYKVLESFMLFVCMLGGLGFIVFGTGLEGTFEAKLFIILLTIWVFKAIYKNVRTFAYNIGLLKR